jgi:TetR/AcrR family transcriptional repressor of nem operon
MTVVIHFVKRLSEGKSMRPTRDQAKENRQRIIDTAARLFREHGIHAVGVDAVMKGAGLTHGGFYGHFKSKEELTAEAGAHAMREALARDSDFKSVEEFARVYLSEKHRDDVADGCIVAALGPELARQPEEKRDSITDYIRIRIEQIEMLRERRGEKADRGRAIAEMSSLLGALVMARAVNDKALSDEILQETVRFVASDGREAKPEGNRDTEKIG